MTHAPAELCHIHQATKLIIMDLGNVLVDIDMNKTIAQMAALGVKNIERHVTQSHSIGGIFTDFERGLVSEQEFCQALREMGNIEASDEDLCKAWNAMIGPLPEEKVRLVENLRKSYKVVILSNTNETHKKYFNPMASQWGYPTLDHLFDKTWYSHEMHMSKPNADIYNKVLEYHKVKPQEALFFDDSQANLDGASSIGIITRLVSPKGKGLWEWFEK